MLYSIKRKIYRYTRWPTIGSVNFGHLRRLKPISANWGFERGLPVDRYYIEKFLSDNTTDIQGHVLEIKEDLYASRFGGERVTKIDVLHVEEGNPDATIVADLTCADQINSNKFDCIILTQTLNFIYDLNPALRTLYRILKSNGVLLATVSGISKISREDMDRWGHYWNFTTCSIKQLFLENFSAQDVIIKAHGNVFSAICYMHGIASEELTQKELDYIDPDYQLLITIRAAKS